MPGKLQDRRLQPDKTSTMPHQAHQVKNLRPLSLFEGYDSPGVVFGAAIAKSDTTKKGRHVCSPADPLAMASTLLCYATAGNAYCWQLPRLTRTKVLLFFASLRMTITPEEVKHDTARK